MTAAYQQHIAELAARLRITIAPRASYGGRAYKKTRTVAIRPVKSASTYAVALHEIGHIAGRQPDRPVRTRSRGMDVGAPARARMDAGDGSEDGGMA